MSGRARTFGIVAIAVTAFVVVVALVAVRWLLDPNLLRGQAESRLSAALGQPVTIGTVGVSLFPTPAVTGTNIVVRQTARGGGSITIHAVRMVPRLSSLLHRPIVIDRVEIEGLAVNVGRDAAGRWALPLPSPSAGGNGAEAGSAFDVADVSLKNGRLVVAPVQLAGTTRAMATQAAIEHMEAALHRAGDVTRLDSMTATIGRSKVAGNGALGTDGLSLSLRWTDLKAGDLQVVFALLGTTAPPGLAVEGKSPLALDLRVRNNGTVSASGTLSADRAALGSLTITQFQSPLSFSGNRLALDPMSFHAYSGTGRGRLAANVLRSPVPWTFDATLQRLDIEQLVNANTSAKNKVSGTGTLDAHLRGTSLAPVERTVAGTAGVNIANGVIRDFPLVAALYSALKIGAGSSRDLHFKALSATFTLANARATTSDLLARTGEMTMTAAGSIGFDQTIAMDGKAVFSAAKSGEFVHSIRELSSLANSNGEIEVPFSISGTAASPHFSIDVANMLRRGVTNELKKRIGDKLKDLFKKIK